MTWRLSIQQATKNVCSWTLFHRRIVMKVLLLFAVISLGQGALLGSKKCTYGPAYWCSHVDHARECGTMQHCITRVWNHRQQGMTGATEGCFGVIETLDDVRRSGIPHNLLEKMAASCTKMPAEKRSVCKELLMNNQNEVQLLLQSNLPSVNVATALGLCGGVSESAPQVDNKQVLQETRDVCTDCLNFFGDLQQMFNKSEMKFAEMVKDKICVKLRFFENLCNETVDTYTAFFVKFVEQQLDPQDLCFLFRFCGNGTHADFVENFRALAAKVRFTSAECDLCHNFVKDVQNALRDPDMQNQILSLLENDVCSLLPGDLGTQCKTYVSEYGPMAFQVLVAELDPEIVCQELGVCNATAAGKKLTVVPLGEAMTSVHVQRVEPQSQAQFSPVCLLCEEVVKKLEDMIFTNATEAEVMAALEKVCNLLPAQWASECDDFVEKYGPEIAQIWQKVGPEAICSALHLCFGNKPAAVVPAALPVKSAEVCLACETVMTSVRDYLNDPDHQKTIEQLVDKVCDLLPASYRNMCQELISAYKPEFFKLLDKFDDPVKVCTALRLCGSKMTESSQSGHPLTFVPMVRLQPAMPHLLCRQDPKVVCGNLETARRCKAVEYCVQNYGLKVGA